MFDVAPVMSASRDTVQFGVRHADKWHGRALELLTAAHACCRRPAIGCRRAADHRWTGFGGRRSVDWFEDGGEPARCP